MANSPLIRAENHGQHAIAVHQHEGWTATHFIDDPGFSGKNLERPGMQSLLREVRSGNVDVVVAYKLDRITRYLPDFYEFWKVLEQHKVNFVSATQSFDTSTPMGMLMLNMLLSFGQFERETIAERISHKIAERAKKGMWNGGWAPFGYAHDPVSKKITPDPVEGPIAKRVFELTKELRSPAKVAATLNAEGLRTSERVVQTRRRGEKLVGGKRFIPYKIKRIVSNPLYKGVIRHKGQDHSAEHPALVTVKLWQEANDALNGKGRVRSAIQERDAHQTLLKGLIRCGVCGHRLTPKPGGKKDKNGNPYLYYTCNEVSKDGRAASCTVRNLPGRTLDEFVLRIIGELGRHPDVIRSAITVSNEEKSRSLRPLKKRRAELQQRRKEIADSLARYLMLARQPGAGHFGEETLAAAEDLSKQKHELERELEKVEIEIAFRGRAVADEHQIAEALRQFDDELKELSFEEQCELVRLIVRGIRVNRLDPEKEPIPGGLSPKERKIRTHWYSINLDVFTNNSLSTICKPSGLSSHFVKNGRGGGIRTHGLFVPNEARYQTALRPDCFVASVEEWHEGGSLGGGDRVSIGALKYFLRRAGIEWRSVKGRFVFGHLHFAPAPACPRFTENVAFRASAAGLEALHPLPLRPFGALSLVTGHW